MLSSNLSLQCPKNLLSPQNRMGGWLDQNTRSANQRQVELHSVDFDMFIEMVLRELICNA